MKTTTNKYNSRIILALLIILFISTASCTKKFDDLNVPQNSIVAEKLDASLLGQTFAQAQYYGLGASAYNAIYTVGADVWAQYWATTQPNFPSDQFFEDGSRTDRYWTAIYGAAMPQMYFVEQFTKQNSMPAANAIAKVWRVLMFSRITDIVGPVPYSEFGNGKTSVAYDSQKDIYTDFFKTLDDATAVLKQNAGGNAFGSNDQVYGGNVNKWLVFANTLRLRLAMRVVYVDPALAKTQAEKAVADGVMLTNADNANVLSTVNSINWLSIWTYISEFRMSAAMASVLNGYSDPRISAYFAPAVIGGTYKGLRNGLPKVLRVAAINDSASFVGTQYLSVNKAGTTAPNRILCSSDAFFLRAEGALRGWNMGGTAADLYNEGIRKSISERTTATSAAIEAYIISTKTPVALNDRWKTPAMSDIPVLYDAAGSFERRLEQIITQKWIATFPDGCEAWAERRRTGYPKGYPIIESLNPDIPVTGMMRRLRFTPNEIATNGPAVEKARTLLGGPDANTTKVWWDAKP
jgi:hypothetical protein